MYDQVLDELKLKVQPGLTLVSVFMNIHTSNRSKAAKWGTKLKDAKLLRNHRCLNFLKKMYGRMERKLDLWKVKQVY